MGVSRPLSLRSRVQMQGMKSSCARARAQPEVSEGSPATALLPWKCLCLAPVLPGLREQDREHWPGSSRLRNCQDSWFGYPGAQLEKVPEN